AHALPEPARRRGARHVRRQLHRPRRGALRRRAVARAALSHPHRAGGERVTAAWSDAGPGLSALDVAAALGQPAPTSAQQRVIEAPPTPALVVAGAGSGKTETMSGRVVWLVANGHVRRDEVLGLTFTRKAAGELAERIGARLAVIDDYGRRGLLPHLGEIVSSGALRRVDDAAAGRQRETVR